MEHRRRLMQHKVEHSTLLKIVPANKKIQPSPKEKMADRSLVNALANEAIEALQTNDAVYRIGDTQKKPMSKEEIAVTSLCYQVES